MSCTFRRNGGPNSRPQHGLRFQERETGFEAATSSLGNCSGTGVSDAINRLTSAPFAACTRSRQPETTEDNARQDVSTILQSLLKATGVRSDNDAKRSSDNPVDERAEGASSVSMLEAVRMLVAMEPEERFALIAIIKALGT